MSLENCGSGTRQRVSFGHVAASVCTCWEAVSWNPHEGLQPVLQAGEAVEGAEANHRN